MMDSNRAWIKAKIALDIREIDRDKSFCTYTVPDGELMVVEDATQDDSRFYAGAPINTRAGSKIGSLCVIDTKPRVFSAKDAVVLRSLAAA